MSRSQVQSDALNWLTQVRGGGNSALRLAARDEAQQLFFGSDTNRWLSPSARALEMGAPVADGERDAENAELVQERLRRRAMPLKSLLLRSAPPPQLGAAVPSMAIGFDAIDTRNFAHNIGSLFFLPAPSAAGSRPPSPGVGQRRAATPTSTAAARQALNNVVAQSELASSAASRAGAAAGGAVATAVGAQGGVRIGEDGICAAAGLRSVAAADNLVRHLTQGRLDVCVTHLNVSNSGGFQQYNEQEGPLARRVVPLAFARDEMPWLRIAVLEMDNCQLHDYDADFLGRALREASCTLERVSLRNNLLTEDGADRLKKAIKYNSRIQHIDLSGNPCITKPSEKARAILQTMDERLATNRRKKLTR